MSAPYRIVFFGTSEFAVPSLRALSNDPRFEIAAVVTQPDRPVGRHATLTPPPVKRFAEESKIPVIKQPEKLKEEPFRAWIESEGPSCDAFVIVAYGKILPQWLLDLPKRGIVNVHGSLLPRWRGPSPIQAAIAAGDAVTGVTVMRIDAEMDHGPVLATVEERVRDTDTGGSLHDRLAELGASILPDVLAGYLDGTVTPVEQDHSAATVCKILTRDDGRIDWTKDAAEIERLIRAFDPWPGTWTEFQDKRLKILSARLASSSSATPGTWEMRSGSPVVACGSGTALEIVHVQPEGGKPMSGAEFARGLRT